MATQAEWFPMIAAVGERGIRNGLAMNYTRVKPTVIVVDDEVCIRNFICKVLHGDYDVLLAASGREAMCLFEKYGSRIAALITDVQMPKVNGAELVEWLHEQDGALPVVMMSGHPGKVEISRLLQRTKVVWLPKPFRIEELEKALAGILASAEDLNQLTKGEKMATQIDPVCGMKVDEEKAAGQSEYEHHTYYFCASFCKRNFDRNPEKYIGKSEEIKKD